MAGELTGIAEESCSLKSRRVPSTIIIKISIVLSTIFAAHNTPKTETRPERYGTELADKLLAIEATCRRQSTPGRAVSIAHLNNPVRVGMERRGARRPVPSLLGHSIRYARPDGRARRWNRQWDRQMDERTDGRSCGYADIWAYGHIRIMSMHSATQLAFF